MATISNTPRPGYVWDSTDNVWYPIGVGAHQHTNAADTPAVMPYSTYAAAGKNKIMNGDFAINQRNFTSVTTDSTYGFDRWKLFVNGGTNTHTPQTFTPGTAPVSGYEGTNFARVAISGQSIAANYTFLSQAVENVRTLAGQTVTMSFWAKAASGTPKIAVVATQNFGSGGSPSSPATTNGGTVTLSTSWARYSTTFTIPSIAGYTIGTTANTSFLRIDTWLSAGSDYPQAQGIGIQNNTFDIWGVQLEAGSTVTAFQTATGNPASELAACQRYYYRVSGTVGNRAGGGITPSSTSFLSIIPFPVTMRTSPTAVEQTGTASDYSVAYSASTVCSAVPAFFAATTYEALTTLTVASGLTANQSAHLRFAGTAFLGWSAEL